MLQFVVTAVAFIAFFASLYAKREQALRVKIVNSHAGFLNAKLLQKSSNSRLCLIQIKGVA